MNCEKSRELFIDYLGEELSKSDAKELKGHLKACQGCRQELALLTSTKGALRSAWPDEAIPQNLTFDFAHSHLEGFWTRFREFRIPKVVLVSLTVTVCFILCLVSLALVRAQIQFENGNFSLSFGRVVQSVPPAPAGYSITNTPQLNASGEPSQDFMDRVLQRLEQKQEGKLQQWRLEARSEFETKRNADLRRIAREFEYVKSTQNVVWKQAVENNSYLETLARDFFARTVSADSAQQ